MNSGPTAFMIVSETIRSILAMADASMCQPERPEIGRVGQAARPRARS